MSRTRTEKGVLNGTTTLLFYIIGICVTFLVRRYFLSSFGEEVLGMKGTIANFLGVLNLAELGVATAIAYALYKPLVNNDREAINEIISVQAWFYRRVAIFLSIATLILFCFFPFIFRSLKAPQWYAYTTFLIFFWESLMSYLINYRAIIFNADQRSYRLTLNLRGIHILKNLIQLALLYFYPHLENLYLYYLLVEIGISILGIYLLEKMIQKDYPWLEPQVKEGRSFLKKHKEIITKTKQVFAHQLAGTALVQVSPILVLVYSSYELVGFYTNYSLIIGSIAVGLEMSFNVLISGIGNLVAEGNSKGVKKMFWEFLALKHLFATIIALVFYTLSKGLIIYWLGDNESYILPEMIVVLLSLNLYLRIARVYDVFAAAYGLFQDVWAPLVEAIINIAGGLLLGYICSVFYEELGFTSSEYAGIFGVLLGATLSILIIVFIWKPYFLFSEAFHQPVSLYWKNYVKYPIISLTLITIAYKFISSLALDFSTLPLFILNSFLIIIAFSTLSFFVFFLLSKGMREISFRLKRLAFAYLKK